MTRKIILAVMLLATAISHADGQYAPNAYTLTPVAVGTVNVSVAIQTKQWNSTLGAYVLQVTDYPVNALYPVFSKDSVKVQFLDIYDKSNIIMSAPDSISHFTTDSYQFFNKDVKGLDSFWQVKMIR